MPNAGKEPGSPESMTWEYIQGNHSSKILRGAELHISDESVWNYIYKRIESYDTRIAQVDDNGSSITFEEILKNSSQLCSQLEALGLGQGQVVAIISDNTLDFIWILLGCLKTRAAVLLMENNCVARELDNIFTQTTPRFVFCSNLSLLIDVDGVVLDKIEKVICTKDKTSLLMSKLLYLDQLLQAELSTPSQLKKTTEEPIELYTEKQLFPRRESNTSNEFHTPKEGAKEETEIQFVTPLDQEMTQSPRLQEEEADQTKPVASSDDLSFRSRKEVDDVALVLSSSIPNGSSKGVMLTHSNVVAAISTGESYVHGEDTVLNLLPFQFTDGVIQMLMCLCQGSKLVLLKKFQEENLTKIISKHKVSHLFLTPHTLSSLTKAPNLEKSQLQTVKHVWTGSSSLTQKLQEEIIELMDPSMVMYQFYGLTETTFITLVGLSTSAKPGSVGLVTPGMAAKVINPTTGALLSAGEKGELCFRGALVMKGYIGDKDATAAVIDGEGWLHSGNFGCYDREGYFYIASSGHDVIFYNGYQISSSELESMLLKHSQITDAAVIGVPDNDYGELPMAFYVPKPGSWISPYLVKKYVSDQVSPHKRLHGGAKSVDKIPKTATGEVRKDELHALVKCEAAVLPTRGGCVIS